MVRGGEEVVRGCEGVVRGIEGGELVVREW